jgi:cellulose synthase/poly-beta-1,6-N-acetylglucosamine synthase-like glycosyltransferase
MSSSTIIRPSDLDTTLFRSDLNAGDLALSIFMFLALLGINVYALAKLTNLIRAVLSTRCFTNKPIQGGKLPSNDEDLPVVTIQICSYNEASVIEETINAACSVDWPKGKLHVHVLDDSTDETSEIIDFVAASWQERGVSCVRKFRPDRVGYKAGSLYHHTPSIQGGFVAMFDSDHRAEPDFLRRAIPQFYDDNGNDKLDIGTFDKLSQKLSDTG